MTSEAQSTELNDTEILELTEKIKEEESRGSPLIGVLEEMPALLKEYENGNEIYKNKINNLITEGYNHFRRIRGDGNCFYRAITYAFIELVSKDSQAATSAKERLENVGIPLLSELGFDSDIMLDFYQPLLSILDNVKDPSISIGDYLKVTLNDDEEVSNSIVVFMRYLTSATIRKNADDFIPFLFAYEGDLQLDDEGMPDIKKFCETYVEVSCSTLMSNLINKNRHLAKKLIICK